MHLSKQSYGAEQTSTFLSLLHHRYARNSSELGEAYSKHRITHSSPVLLELRFPNQQVVSTAEFFLFVSRELALAWSHGPNTS